MNDIIKAADIFKLIRDNELETLRRKRPSCFVVAPASYDKLIAWMGIPDRQQEVWNGWIQCWYDKIGNK